MKFPALVCSLTLMMACNQVMDENQHEKQELPHKITRTDFQQIIDSAGVSGSILIYDAQTKQWYSNDFVRSNRGFLPASTFKIPNSIIALETGVIQSDSTLFKWDGQKRRLPIWEQDLIFRDAFHLSCVPCYQEIARKIGSQRMNEYLKKFDYGNMIVHSSNIDVFWLEGESAISPFQQIAFLSRYYFWNLPISMRTYSIMKRLMIIDTNPQYTLSGKSGWAIRNDQNVGWFVGYLEKGKDVYFIATNIEPHTSFNMDLFPKIRNEISLEAFKKLGLIQ